MGKMIFRNGFILMAVIGWGLLVASARAGSLDDPAAPTDAASALYTLQDVYNRLDTGAAGAKRAGPFAEPASGPAVGAITLDDIMAKAPSASTNAAEEVNVLAGKVYWGLKSGAWGHKTGAMAAGAFSAGSSAVAAGYYAATNLAQVDPDLAAANIKAGATIFGVPGNAGVVDTTGGDAAAGDIVAGKKAYASGAEVTGSMAIKTLSPDSAAMAAGYYGATNLAQVDPDLAAANILSGVALFGITGSPVVVDTSLGGADAAAGDVVSGKVAWVGGSALTGTIAVMAFSPTTTAMAAGYYAATNLSAVDTNLAAPKIKTGATLFGVAGTYAGETIYATSGVPKTGQTTSYAEADDGWYSTNRNVAWPIPRFTVQGDTNVVLDNLTGLMWARNANYWGVKVYWGDAITSCNGLSYGGYDDWRMPNVKELSSLIDYGMNGPALCNTVGDGAWVENDPFSGVVLDSYWTSTRYMFGKTIGSAALRVSLSDGSVGVVETGTRGTQYVWPVRGGTAP